MFVANLKDLGKDINGRIILKQVLSKKGCEGVDWIQLAFLFVKKSNKLSDSIEVGTFFSNSQVISSKLLLKLLPELLSRILISSGRCLCISSRDVPCFHLITPRKLLRCYLKICDGRFFSHPSQFFIHCHLQIRRYIINTLVKELLHKLKTQALQVQR